MREWLWRMGAEGWPWQRRGFFVDRDGENDYVTLGFRWFTINLWFRDPAWGDWGVTKEPFDTRCFRCGPVHIERIAHPADIWGPLVF